MNIQCPFCNIKQKQKPMKSWAYGKLITSKNKDGTEWGPAIKCSRYLCKCGKLFNFYLSSKDKNWTIPKAK